MTETPTPPEPGSFASEPLDRLLVDWHNTELGTGVADFLEDTYGADDIEAHERVERAEVALLAGVASFIDAFRVHPELSYAGAIDRLFSLLEELPEPPVERKGSDVLGIIEVAP